MRLNTLRMTWLAAVPLAAAIAVPNLARAEFPDKPITLMIPYGAGGGTDLASRILAEEMTKVLGQQVIAKNDAGGGGAVALGQVFAAKPDGYTIAVGTA